MSLPSKTERNETDPDIVYNPPNVSYTGLHSLFSALFVEKGVEVNSGLKKWETINLISITAMEE
ncbi:hypothetical protein J6590_099901 [Homalodisca vitripennis]|nr:hypothetical protein J6590_099901 [Homalodisca vitripennis]